jgi:preprotein translocase subunit YajC
MLEGAPRFAPETPVFALLAQADNQPSIFGGLGFLPFLGLFFVIFYFIVMRPQAKQQNEHKSFLDKLGKGDEVVTAGGVVGKVDKVAGDLVFVEVANNVKVRVIKSQITGAFKAAEEKPAEEPAKK